MSEAPKPRTLGWRCADKGRAGRRGEYNPRVGGAADALDDAITKLEVHMIAEDA
jgi:hypothetical protein